MIVLLYFLITFSSNDSKSEENIKMKKKKIGRKNWKHSFRQNKFQVIENRFNPYGCVGVINLPIPPSLNKIVGLKTLWMVRNF